MVVVLMNHAAAPNPKSRPGWSHPVDHTPATPASDDRPLKILERTPVPEPHKQRLFDLVRAAQAAAADDGEELQAEFGKDAVAMITGCNQFLRLYRGGSVPGAVELLLDPQGKEALAGHIALGEPEGAIFRMFGWVRIDPTAAELDPLAEAVRSAYRKARAAKKA